MQETTWKKYLSTKHEISFKAFIKHHLKEVSYSLTKRYKTSLLPELIFLTLTCLQLLSFPLNQKLMAEWNCSPSFAKLFLIIEYFHVVPLFKGNNTLFFLVFYFSFCLLVITLVLLVFAIVCQGNPNKIIITIWLNLIWYISHVIYIPLFLIFLSITSCNNNNINTYLPTITCWNGAHLIHACFAYFSTVLLFAISYFGVSTIYTRNLFNNNEITSKTTATSDITLLVIKSLWCISYTYSSYSSSSRVKFFLILFYFFLSLYLLNEYLRRNAYDNKIIKLMYNWILTIFSWCNWCLLLSAVFGSVSYNWGMFQFVFGTVWIWWLFVFKERKDFVYILTRTRNANEALQQLNGLIALISNFESSRIARLLIKGYIEQYEKNCSYVLCPWKEYLMSCKNSIATGTNNSQENVIYLYQHVEHRFNIELELYSNSVELRISYCLFWLKMWNKKNKAWTELIALSKTDFIGIEYEFFVYKYIRYIENNDDLNTEKQVHYTLNIQNLMFKKELNVFKALVKKVASLYIDFWSILLISDQDSKESLEQWNETGKKINQCNIEIDGSFTELQQLKWNDKSVLCLYSDYFRNVINNNDRAGELRQIITENENNELNDTNNWTSFIESNIDILNSSALSLNDRNQFIIISSQPENFGMIVNISLSLCSSLGYTKNELIGSNYDKIIPKIYWDKHNELLFKKVNETKQRAISNNEGNNNCSVNKQLSAALLWNKSKYWVKMRLQVGIIANELNECFYIAKVLGKSVENEINIWVNSSLHIEHFSVNALHQLGWSHNLMNSSQLITDAIKETSEAFLSRFTEEANVSKVNAMQLRKEIQEELLLNKDTMITWKRPSRNENFDRTKSDHLMKCHVSEEKINSAVIGYVYTFTLSGYEFNHIGDAPQHSTPVLSNSEINNSIKGDSNSTNTQKINNEGSWVSGSNSNLDAARDIPTRKFSPILITKEFIPNDTAVFNWDPTNMSFLKNNRRDSDTEKKKSFLKSLAWKKFHKSNPSSWIQEKSSINETSEYSSSNSGKSRSSNDNEDNEDSKSGESVKDKSETSEDEGKKNGNKNSNNNNNNDNSYYHVNMEKIKYKIYDFKRNIISEIVSYNKTSEIEDKLNVHSKDQKEDNTSTASTSEDDSGKNNDNKPWNYAGKGLLELNQKEIFLRKIENGWACQESQPTIMRWKQVSYISWLILLAIGAGFLVFFYYIFRFWIENVLIIQRSHDWHVTMISSYFYVRELNLYNHELYEIKPSTEEGLSALVEEIQGKWLDYFNTTNEQLNYIYTTFTRFSPNITALLNEENIEINIIKNDFNVSKYNFTLKAAWSEVNNALFQVATQPFKTIIPTNDNVFYFWYNSMNALYIGVSNQNEYFIDNIHINIAYYRLCIIFLFIAAFLLLVWVYFILVVAYEKVAEKKESYLQVFFQIEKNVLMLFLENLDLFNKKLILDKTVDLNSFNNVFGNNVGRPDTKSMEEYDNQSNDFEGREDEKLTSNTKDIALMKPRHSQSQKNKVSKETWQIKLNISFALFVVYMYITLIFYFFITYLNDLRDRVTVFRAFYQLYNNQILVYISLIAYIFDEKSSWLNTKNSDFVTSTLPNIFDAIAEKKMHVTSNIDKFPADFKDLYRTISESDICYFGEEMFNSLDKSCTTFLFGSGKYGFDHMMSSYIVEIIAIKNWNHRYEQRKRPYFNYNLTMIGTAYQEETLKWAQNESDRENYWENHQIRTLSNYRIVEIDNFLWYFLLPIVEDWKTKMKSEWNKIINGKKDWFLLLSAVLWAGNCLWFVGVFLTFVNGLDRIIYKTKNMLEIIPKQVLYNIPNILNILGVSDNDVTKGSEVETSTVYKGINNYDLNTKV